MAYRKEGAEEYLTSPVVRREDKDGKSDCFQLMSRQSKGKKVIGSICSVKGMEAGGIWESLQDIL